jgi:superfamily II DNA or RNA helicase
MTDKTKEFLQKLKDSGNWNEDYDYSKVVYEGSSTKLVLVIDKNYNTEHLINPNNLILGYKCSIFNLKNGVVNYHDAKKFAQSLNLTSPNQWREYNKNVGIPHNIPMRPDVKYKNNGWVSWSDFLGFKTKMGPSKNYLPFEEARVFIRNLVLKNTNDWRKYCESGEKPDNIPYSPNTVYKSTGWVSMGDWLGTGKISDNLKTYLPFEEAREFARTLGLKTGKEWQKWWDENEPNNIPKTVNQTYNSEGWVSMGDFLGVKIGFNGEYLSFEEAREFTRTLGLKSYDEWREYCKSGNKPSNIPTHVNRHYKDKGWISFFDWLGYDRTYLPRYSYLQFEEAREFARTLGLKYGSEWREYCKNSEKPIEIPNDPRIVYKDKWISMGDWLGSDVIASQKINYLSFEEAREFVRNLGLKGQKEWQKWWVENRPSNIPYKPERTYENEFISIMDWLGYSYFSFEEAREFARTLGLNTQNEWREYCKSNDKPVEIPTTPQTVYQDKGWISWGDFLGCIGNGKHIWRKSYILDFIKSLETELINLDSVELITIINSNNLAKKLREIGSLEDLISAPSGSKERARLVHEISDRLESLGDEEDYILTETGQVSEFEEALTVDESIDVSIEPEELELLDPIQELHMYDNQMVTASLDNENIDFLIKNQLKKLWNRVLNNKVDIEKFKNETGGEKFMIIKNSFFNEYEKVIKIESPSDYIFKYQPNLMQKLITYRLINEKKYGNWSGTGAGKTLSAIFAGRYAGAKNTLIICNNATVEGWTNSIHEYFSNNKVYTKKFLDYTDPSHYSIINKYDINFKDGDNNYLVLNYETFQLEDGEFIVSELLKNNIIDYIILDEVQNVKQRDDDESSRRNVVNKLIIHSKEKNEDLLIMAMSATPVINNLTEPKKLIELLTGEAHNELNTNENVINGIEMYKALTRHGLRYKPNYGISVNEEVIEIDGQHLSDEIIKIPKGAVVEFERVLVQTKLDGIKDKIQKGTLIYTHYVTELSHVIGDYIKDLGFSIGYYTGEDKSGLRNFKEGKIDVLIGSSPIGTGVDGIQYVCNTLIPIVLPWTSSEYDQLVGRINRQGSNFDNVNIYIPQVTINVEDGIWSWDKRRHNIIKFKATLADLAVDGRVPKNLLPSKTKLIEDAKKELADWVNRLQGGDLITFEREEFMIPLNPKLIERSRAQLGDFSDLNQKWSVTRSDNTHDRLAKDPTEWYYYHTLYSEKRKTWSEIPYIEIAKKINVRPDWVVGDFGCGENLLSKEITNKVYAFDHVAIDDNVYACDIKSVPIEDSLLDVAVFSLSLMGSNYVEYFKEAYRTLKTYGNIFICEPASKWEGKEEELKKQIESVGFKCFGTVKNTDKFIYIDGIKY